ncbi:phage minor head protein [Streptomyces roseolus]|uniref:phage minor head protein n=1 Tax=Streptomyces roseolus TaxID=67358 RepID=UPI0037A534A3
MADRDRQLDQAEADFAAAVAAALTQTADEFADAVRGATELVAARFSVGRIARMWGARTRGLIRRLLGTADTAVLAAADDLGTPVPEGWDDLPARHADGTLPEPMSRYVETTEHLLRAVGDRLAEAARRELAAGIDAGETIDQLRTRLRAAFARDGAQLGPSRERRIAQTEASRAWNTATLEAARAITGPDRPVVKQWITRHDRKVRTAHEQVDAQLRPLEQPFSVAGVAMQAPGDPSAPPELVINCRCRLAVAPETRLAAFEVQARLGAEFSEARESRVEPQTVTAASGHTGAMIALVPSQEDAERLALATDGAEAASELHATLFHLGEAADWREEARTELIDRVRAAVADQLDDVIHARAFGANHWNADGDNPCWVWAVGDDRDRPVDAPRLETARYAALYALEDLHQQPDLPVQHSPWQPHVCATYSADDLLKAMNERLGPIRFDRLRVAFAGQYTDFPLAPAEAAPMAVADSPLAARRWSTPGDTALAFEDEETGDGRVFRPGALYWSGPGPWPLQYADEMLMGHQGAELAGAIQTLDRDGSRIPGSGVLYPGLAAGAESLMILEQGGPLGVSVDLDDVALEFVDRRPAEEGEDDEGPVLLLASLPSASLLRLADGSWSLTASHTNEWTASGTALARTGTVAQLLTGPGGTVPYRAVRQALDFTGQLTLTAAAGDRDDQEHGTVVHRESSGDLLMRVTRARLRGATLVAMPAYDRARIVLDGTDTTASADGGEDDLQADGSPAQKKVVDFVKTSPVPVGAKDVAHALTMRIETARGHLVRAAKAGLIIRLARGMYVGPSTDLSVVAAATGDIELPVHDNPERPWDSDEAAPRVLKWATGDDGTVDPGRLAAAYLWRDDDADPATAAAYRFPFADVIDGELQIVAEGVYAAGSALQGADLPEDDVDAVKDRAAALYARLAETYGDDTIRPPWTDDEDDMAASELVASAWEAMQDLEPMPAAWFREPTPEELPPGSGGVHLAKGRVYGWVAQAGVPHAGYPGKNLTIESLGKLDLSHFLRARFPLDDGTMMRVGAMTMDVGHHRDGAECETAACQFDDTRTVGAIVTVGQNEGGLWFSGAAAPWLADWDRKVFAGCQPSYHLKQGRGGRWQLRAVLTVPVPGHSSQLLAAAVAERSNLALAASAADRADLPDTSGHGRDLPADASGQLPDNPAKGPGGTRATGPDLPGQRPDIAPDNPADLSGHSPDPSGDLDVLAATLLADDSVLDVFLDALNRRQQQREDAARDEAARLAASVIDPARAQLAAGNTMEGAA